MSVNVVKNRIVFNRIQRNGGGRRKTGSRGPPHPKKKTVSLTNKKK